MRGLSPTPPTALSNGDFAQQSYHDVSINLGSRAWALNDKHEIFASGGPMEFQFPPLSTRLHLSAKGFWARHIRI